MRKIISLLLCVTMMASLLVGCSVPPQDMSALVEASYKSLVAAYDRYLAITQTIMELFDLPMLQESYDETLIKREKALADYEATKAGNDVIAAAQIEPDAIPEAEQTALPEPEPTTPLEEPVAEEPQPQPEKGLKSSAFIADYKDGKVFIDGLLGQNVIEFSLPEGFELLECLEDSYLYSNGIALIELRAQKTPDLPMDALLEDLQIQTLTDERFGSLNPIDGSYFEDNGFGNLVLLFETGENEDTNINWVQYVISDEAIFQMVYTLDIDAQEEDFYQVGEVFDSLHIA